MNRNNIMRQETITIPKIEYENLKKMAEIETPLLISLVKGLEDIRTGRIKPWKRITKSAS
ncbi:MAG TPA: hypothetical protein VJH95_03645 [Candidatus Nanoarchaeia archaeon]|nr:hypothetical protein [Candidatus Nanoarchaeia archaeon]